MNKVFFFLLPSCCSPPWSEERPEWYLGYGCNSFAERRATPGVFFCDKSHLIREVEYNVSLILCRPRRFGKTTFLTMLHEYFDWNNRDPDKFKEVWWLISTLFLLFLHKIVEQHSCQHRFLKVLPSSTNPPPCEASTSSSS